MKSEPVGGASRKLFVGRFDVTSIETEREGSFSLLAHASDVERAVAKWLAHLDDLAKSHDALGPILVYANTILEVYQVSLVKGLLFDHRTHPDELGLRDDFVAPDDDAEVHILESGGGDEQEVFGTDADSSSDVPVF